MVNILDTLDDKSALSDLLDAFQPIEFPECIFEGVEFSPSTGSIGYLYFGAFSYLEGIYSIGMLVLTIFSTATISHLLSENFNFICFLQQVPSPLI